MNMWCKDSIVIYGNDVIMGTPQRWFSRKAAKAMKDAMKSQLRPESGRCKSRVGGAQKRQAVGSPQTRDFDSTNAVYVLGSESESEEYDMWAAFDDEGLAPSTSSTSSMDLHR